jgi:hypothetical protein
VPFAAFGGFADEDGIEVRTMPIALHLVVGAAPDRVADRSEGLDQQGDGVCLARWFDSVDDFAREAAIRLVGHDWPWQRIWRPGLYLAGLVDNLADSRGAVIVLQHCTPPEARR